MVSSTGITLPSFAPTTPVTITGSALAGDTLPQTTTLGGLVGVVNALVQETAPGAYGYNDTLTASVAGNLNGTSFGIAQSISGSLFLPASFTFNIGSGTNLFLSSGPGTLTDFTDINMVPQPGELVKAGLGTLTLALPTSYSGGTSIQGGTLAGDGMSLNGDITVGGAGTLDFLVDFSGPNSFDPYGSVSIVAGGTVLIDYQGRSRTFEVDSAEFSAATTDGSHATLKNFQIGDGLVLSDFTDVKNTSVSLTGTGSSRMITVTETDHVTNTVTQQAVFNLDGSSLSDDAAETVVIQRNFFDGAVAVTPAIAITDANADDTGVGSLRHALATASTLAQQSVSGAILVFDHALNNSTIKVNGAIDLLGELAFAPTPLNVPFGTEIQVKGGDHITLEGIDGSFSIPGGPSAFASGGLHASSGFLKVGGGTLTLTGDQSSIIGTVSVAGGTLDIETDFDNFLPKFGASSLAFLSGGNATIQAVGAMLGGRQINNFTYGDTIKVIDFAGGGHSTLSGAAFGSGSGTLNIDAIRPDGTANDASFTLSGPATDFVVLTDSIDGRALIRPAVAVANAAGLTGAVNLLTLPALNGGLYSGTSGDVIDLSGANASQLDLGIVEAVQLVNPVHFYDSTGTSVTINGTDTLVAAISGTDDFFKSGGGTLVLAGNELGILGTISIGGGTLAIGTDQFNSHTVKVDLAPGHGTLEGTAAHLDGLSLQNFHLGNGLLVDTVGMEFVTLTGAAVSSGQSTWTVSDFAGSPGSVTGTLGSVTVTLDAHLGLGLIAVSGGGEVVATVSTGTYTTAPNALGSGFTEVEAGAVLDLKGDGFFGGTLAGPGFVTVENVLNIQGATLANVMSVNLGGELVVGSAASGHLKLATIAPGAVIDFANTLYTSVTSVAASTGFIELDFAGASVTGFAATVSASLALPTLISDGHGGTYAAFGNQTITANGDDLDKAQIFNSGRPTTLSITGASSGSSSSLFAPPFIDFLSASLGQEINTLDVSAVPLANAVVRLDSSEFTLGSLKTIKGTGATILQLQADSLGGANFDLTADTLPGVAAISLQSSDSTLIVDPSTVNRLVAGGLHTIEGSSDGTDTLLVQAASSTIAVDLSQLSFHGNGVIESNATTSVTYTIADGGVIPHIVSGAVGQQVVINLLATAAATLTADEIGYAQDHGFTLEVGGVGFPTTALNAPFVPPAPGASGAVLVTGGALSGTLNLGATSVGGVGASHIVLPSGSWDLTNLGFSGNTQPVVLFGAPNGAVTLPGSAPAGQTTEFFLVDGGNNTITMPSATPAQIWGGSGHDAINLSTGPGTVVGGSGFASICGGSASGTSYSDVKVLLFGGQSGGDLSGGGDFSELISEGSDTTMQANNGAFAVGGSVAGAIHQTFFGSHASDPKATDDIYLSAVAGASDLVVAGSVFTSVTGSASNDTVLGGTGPIVVHGGGAQESLTFIANVSSGGKEESAVLGNAAGQLMAFGGDGHELFQASSGLNTLIGGTGNTAFTANTGDGYMLSQGVKDVFTFNDTGLGSGHVFVVDGFTSGVDVLQIVGFTSPTIGSATTLKAGTDTTTGGASLSFLSATDAFTSGVIGKSALTITLSDQQVIYLVGVTSLGANDLVLSPPLLLA